MNEAVVVGSRPLSQVERVVDTFVAPSKTFTDILRNTSWWLPCVLVIAMAAIYGTLAMKKVGPATMADNMIRTMPSIQQTMADNPAQAPEIHRRFEKQMSGSFYSSPVTFLVGGFAIAALFMMTANFVFGGSARYWQVVGMFWYSMLPMIVFYAMICVLLAAGINIDTFQVTNPAATNLGYFLSEGSSPTVVALASLIDIFSIWMFLLQGLGMAKIAKISFAKGCMSVAIWWVIYSAIKVFPAIFFS